MTPEEKKTAQLELVEDLEYEVMIGQQLGWGEEVWQPMIAVAAFLRERITDRATRVDWNAYK